MSVRLNRLPTGAARFTDPRYVSFDRRMRDANWSTWLPSGTFTYPATARVRWEVFHTAKVPLVPLPLRPADLSRYHILWEAEWNTVPPRDPALLRRLGGRRSDLYAVVAIWDLTELERAVLAGRT